LGKTYHDINGISTTDTNTSHTETTLSKLVSRCSSIIKNNCRRTYTVGSVRIGTDEETTRESVVLEQNLVDDTRAGLPETNVVLGASRGKEVVDLLVDADGAVKILLTTDLSLDQVIAVDGGRVGDLVHAGAHELKDSHLGGGILASNAIRAKLEVRATTLDLLAMRIVQVRVENLLGIGQGTVEAAADDGEVLGHLLVVDEVVLLPVVLLDLFWSVSATFRWF
jgi:hypothetical protein